MFIINLPLPGDSIFISFNYFICIIICTVCIYRLFILVLYPFFLLEHFFISTLHYIMSCFLDSEYAYIRSYHLYVQKIENMLVSVFGLSVIACPYHFRSIFYFLYPLPIRIIWAHIRYFDFFSSFFTIILYDKFLWNLNKNYIKKNIYINYKIVYYFIF